MASRDDTAELLAALREGDRGALDRLVPRLYEELHRIAGREVSRRRMRGAPSTTGLLHETYVKLVARGRLRVKDREHFLALAATAMRHILVDHVRRRRALRRGGGWRRIPLDDGLPAPDTHLEELIELDEALTRLERFDGRLRDVVECRFFGGMTVTETAAALGVSPRTVNRAWQRARAWLVREMEAG